VDTTFDLKLAKLGQTAQHYQVLPQNSHFIVELDVQPAAQRVTRIR
jgi:hypothetical protein